MKIVVTNTVLSNTGDAAIMLGTKAILERAMGGPVDMTVCDQQPGVVRSAYPEFDARPLLYDRLIGIYGRRFVKFGILAMLLAAALWRTPLRKAALALLPKGVADDLRALGEADMIVAAGGTYLVPHYRIRPKLLELMAAHLMGRPFALFTQSLGPFDGGRVSLLRSLLERAKLILVRDGRSRGHLARLGVPDDRVAECADAAFALSRPARRRNEPGERLSIAVSVRHWPHFDGDSETGMERYRAAIAVLVRHLVETYDAEVTFVSTCQGVNGYWTDDSHVAADIVRMLPESVRDRVSVNNSFHRPEQLIDILAGFDLVVATRMHVAILGLAAGVPVLPISYEFKTRALFERLQQQHLCTDMERVTAAVLCRAADQVLAKRTVLRTELAGKIAQLQRSAFEAGTLLKSRMETA